MGLEGVELVMALEEEFSVEIDDAAAERMATPGDVIEYLMVYLGHKGRRCLRQQRFYRLRALLREELGLPRKMVTLNLQYETILPVAHRAALWDLIKEQTSNHRWPSLQRPVWVRTGLWLLCASFFLFLLRWRFYPAADWLERLNVAFWLSLMAGGAGLWFTRRLRVMIPPNMSTIGESILATTMPAPKLVHFEDGKARDAIAARVKKIVVDQLGIAESQFREDARFIEDYGIS